MLLKNNAKCLITINGPLVNGMRSVAYDIKPGDNPAVEVPDELCDSDFVKAMIDNGHLIAMSQRAAPAAAKSSNEVEALQAQCDLLKIQYDKRWGADKLKEAIDKASK